MVSGCMWTWDVRVYVSLLFFFLLCHARYTALRDDVVLGWKRAFEYLNASINFTHSIHIATMNHILFLLLASNASKVANQRHRRKRKT